MRSITEAVPKKINRLGEGEDTDTASEREWLSIGLTQASEIPVSVIEIHGSLGLSSGVSFLGLPLSFSPNQVISRTWPALPRLTLSQLEKVGTGILRVLKCP